MQLIKSKFNTKTAKEILLRENKFIVDFFSVLPIPVSKRLQDSKTDEEFLLPRKADEVVPQSANKKQNRASSLVELKKRFEAVKNRKLTIKEKIQKKHAKNKIKKNEKKNERNAKKKLANAVKATIEKQPNEEKKPKENSIKLATPKPVFNKDDKIVFSKFDFSEIGKKKIHKQEKDPKKILKKIEKQKEKLRELEQSGEVEKVALTKEKNAWKAALAKAEGRKVKDDPLLLKKSIKKQEQLKRKSAKKWQERKEKVEQSKQERQNKRQDNIQKKRDKKKAIKTKKAVKKGKIVLTNM